MCRVGLSSKVLSTVAIGLALAALSGCAAPPIWRLYDKCAEGGPSFVTMVRCGKLQRELVLSKNPWSRSDVGNAFEQYADALAAQVESHQITEADAWARFAEYKTKLISDQQRNEAIAGAAAPPVVVQQAPIYVPPPAVMPLPGPRF
jgi:hypothetical protein